MLNGQRGASPDLLPTVGAASLLKPPGCLLGRRHKRTNNIVPSKPQTPTLEQLREEFQPPDERTVTRVWNYLELHGFLIVSSGEHAMALLDANNELRRIVKKAKRNNKRI